jgi:hypothetical protein
MAISPADSSRDRLSGSDIIIPASDSAHDSERAHPRTSLKLRTPGESETDKITFNGFFGSGVPQAGIDHWRGEEITLESDPHQDVWIDGKLNNRTLFTTTAAPQALEIVVLV